MPGRGPRVSKDVIVWSRLQDLLSDHPQLKEKFDRYFSAGHVGKYIEGRVTGSVARQVNQPPVWLVHYVGLDTPIDIRRRRFDCNQPSIHPAAIITAATISLVRPDVTSATSFFCARGSPIGRS